MPKNESLKPFDIHFVGNECPYCTNDWFTFDMTTETWSCNACRKPVDIKATEDGFTVSVVKVERAKQWIT